MFIWKTKVAGLFYALVIMLNLSIFLVGLSATIALLSCLIVIGLAVNPRPDDHRHVRLRLFAVSRLLGLRVFPVIPNLETIIGVMMIVLASFLIIGSNKGT